MKNILKFLVLLFPWFIGGLLFNSDTIFYKSLNKPVFAPSSTIFPIVWTILYILIAISIYLIFKNNKLKEIPSYNEALLIPYIIWNFFALILIVSIFFMNL